MMININCIHYVRKIGCDHCGCPDRKGEGFLWFKPVCIIHPLYGEDCEFLEEHQKPPAPPPPPPKKGPKEPPVPPRDREVSEFIIKLKSQDKDADKE